jgi:hypothetical protein
MINTFACFRCKKERNNNEKVITTHRKAGQVEICKQCDIELMWNALESAT